MFHKLEYKLNLNGCDIERITKEFEDNNKKDNEINSENNENNETNSVNKVITSFEF